MTREEKVTLVSELTEQLKETPNVYVADSGGMTVSQVNDLRRMCFEAGIKVRVVKNTLFQKALDASEGDYSEIYDSLKRQSAVFFADDDINAPAKLLLEYRKTNELPVLKAAHVGGGAFIGDDQLDALAKLKGKKELLGEIITLLQSPPKTLISALQSPIQTVMGQAQSGANLLHGILKALEERNG